ncbi:MAG: putative metal-binding motif-containing protein [Sandaracinus sp.]
MNRWPTWRALASLVLLAALALVPGCGEATSILVRVTSSTLRVPADVDRLDFTIRGETTGHVENRSFALTEGWPHSLSIRPGPTEANRVTITVQARHGTALVAEAMRTEAFVRGTDLVVDIELGGGPPADAGPTDGGLVDGGPRDAGVDAPSDAGPPDAALDAARDASSDAEPDARMGDAGCLHASDCDDGVACTNDDCVGGACTHEPDDSVCAVGSTCDVMVGCPPRVCASASECDDGRFCNGPESCDGGTMTCVGGLDPCDDGDDCTDDRCDESADACHHTTRDFDRDGAGDAACPAVGGVPATDCDDHRAEVVPGAPDVCDGLDNDCAGGCDSRSTCCRGTTQPCTTMCGTTGERTCGITCGWSICSPPAETCNGVDDDCNGACDDGVGCCAGTSASCTTSCGSTGTRLCGSDCAYGACVAPAETCNGRDDDCDGACDDGFACCAGVPSSCTTVCGSTGTRSCSASCVAGAACTPPAEICNDVDDNCDSVIDEGFSCRNGAIRTCTASCGSVGTQTCASCEWGACTPPTEICFNSFDDDCDMVVDDGCPSCGVCPGATTVSAPGGRYTVTTSASSTSGSCGGGSGAEATLSFSISSTSDVFITTHQSLRDTVIYVRQCACVGGPEMGCNDDANGVTSSALALSDLAPGTYNVFIDTKTPSSQAITVDLFINDATLEADRCGQPFSLNPGTTTLTGNTCGYQNDYDNQVVAGPTACPFAAGGDAEDVLVYFVVPTARMVTVSGCTGTAYDQVLYLRNNCVDGTLGAQLACSDDNCGAVSGMCDSTAASSISAMLSPGIYYMFIDGYGGPSCNCGNFSLAITGL